MHNALFLSGHHKHPWRIIGLIEHFLVFAIVIGLINMSQKTLLMGFSLPINVGEMTQAMTHYL